MKFKYEVSKSPTIHLEEDTLEQLEEIRLNLNEQTGKNLNYDFVIKYLLRGKKKWQN